MTTPRHAVVTWPWSTTICMCRVPIAVWIGAWAQLFVFFGGLRLYLDGQKVYGGPGGGDADGFDTRCGLSHFFLMPLLAPTAVSIAHIVSVWKRHVFDAILNYQQYDDDGQLQDSDVDRDFRDFLNQAVLLLPALCVVGYVLVFWVGSFILFFAVNVIGFLPSLGIALVLVAILFLGGRSTNVTCACFAFLACLP